MAEVLTWFSSNWLALVGVSLSLAALLASALAIRGARWNSYRTTDASQKLVELYNERLFNLQRIEDFQRSQKEERYRAFAIQLDSAREEASQSTEQINALLSKSLERLERLEQSEVEYSKRLASIERTGKEVFIPVHYATDREVTGSSKPNDFYGSDRGTLHYGLATVSIPADHNVGALERPTFWHFEFREKPQKHVILGNLFELSKEDFFAHLASEVMRLENKTAFVFIHGFNVTFAAAARRTAQLAYDLFYVGRENNQATLSIVPILYSWPSNGDVIRYPYDANNAEVSGAHLKIFLKDVAANSGIESLILISHSMGNRTLTVALNEIGLSMRSGDNPLATEIILAAPDIDRDAFLNIASSVEKTGTRVTLYASKNDKALQVSKALNGFPRLGDAADGITVFGAADSIDASVVGDDILAHSYYGQTTVLSDLYNLIMHGNPPGKRFGLLGQGTPPTRYWIVRPRIGA